MAGICISTESLSRKTSNPSAATSGPYYDMGNICLVVRGAVITPPNFFKSISSRTLTGSARLPTVDFQTAEFTIDKGMRLID
jgi:hypothetical protein